MQLGYCPVCLKKIGTRTANGVFRWDFNKAKQKVFVFAYPGRSETTAVHLVLCKDCAETAEWSAIETGLGDEVNFKSFKESAPTATYSHRTDEAL